MDRLAQGLEWATQDAKAARVAAACAAARAAEAAEAEAAWVAATAALSARLRQRGTLLRLISQAPVV